MKTYLIMVRQYDISVRDYILKLYKTTTDCIYRIIGKIYYTALEDIKRITFNIYSTDRENFWKEQGYTIKNYIEPKLSEDKK